MTRRGLLLFAAMCVIWGIPYLLIRVAVRELEPVTLGFSRTMIAALVLLPIAAVRGDLRPLARRWLPILVFAVIEIVIPWFFLARAETRADELADGSPDRGRAARRRRRDDAHRRARAARCPPLGGLCVGMVGVAAIVGLDVHGAGALPLAEVAIVAVCYAVGPIVLARWLSDAPPLGVIAAAIGIAALIYAPFAAFSLPDGVPGWKVSVSVLALGVICTALAFVVFFKLIAEIGPVRATVITYVNPAVAAVLGVTILSEHLTFGMGLGFALVLAGSVLATAARRERATAPTEAPSPS